MSVVCAMSRRTSRTPATSSGSSADVTSSRSSTRGRIASARAIATLPQCLKGLGVPPAAARRTTGSDRRRTCTAKPLDDRAPITCAAVWDALPLGGDVYHAKYARNETYALFPPFAKSEPPLENPTVTPIPGDLCYFAFAGTELGTGLNSPSR
jgi:hypothetical protein